MNNIESINIDGKEVKFININEFVKERFTNLKLTEPETIAWLDQQSKQSCFWDIGANVGIYSIYASIKGIKNILSFEPESSNNYLLNKHIRINNLNDINAYPISLFDKDTIDFLYLDKDYEGWACNSFNEEKDPFLNAKKSKFKQGSVSFKSSSLINSYNIQKPNFCKIDVDGFEHKVIDGFESYLCDDSFESVLIELSNKVSEHKDTIKKLRSSGFYYSELLTKKFTISEGYFEGLCNMIFEKNQKRLQDLEEKLC